MNSSSSSSSSGIGFTSLLAVAFIVLKLCNVINWSWWWVLSPIWIPIGLFLVVVMIFLIYSWRKNVRTKKRLALGMNEWAYQTRNKNKGELKGKNYFDKSKLHEIIEKLKQ